MSNNANRDDDYKRDIRLEHHHAPTHHGAYPTRRPSRFWLFVLSPLPGLSHMYLGLIRRGLFYMASLALLIFLTTAIAPSIIVILTSFAKFALFAVAFFESFSIRRDIIMGKDVSDSIPNIGALRKNKALFAAVIIVAAVIIGLRVLAFLGGLVWLIAIIAVILYFVINSGKKEPKDGGHQ